MLDSQFSFLRPNTILPELHKLVTLKKMFDFKEKQMMSLLDNDDISESLRMGSGHCDALLR
jgi:hypothetical protein